jgi:hypothetical protein
LCFCFLIVNFFCLFLCCNLEEKTKESRELKEKSLGIRDSRESEKRLKKEVLYFAFSFVALYNPKEESREESLGKRVLKKIESKKKYNNIIIFKVVFEI